ncbi:MAG: hypothetical protein EON54_21145 [Alcaligenaceae bacterium]|nr:MAG: hypothetical protein EON54_21145 [Alcaligenaceae bacterium]
MIDEVRAGCISHAALMRNWLTTGARVRPSRGWKTSVATRPMRTTWRARQTLLQLFPKYWTVSDGIAVRFTHFRSRQSKALPLVLNHGWPHSIVEFQKVIEPLVDLPALPAANYPSHVACASLPGLGISLRPAVLGWSIDCIASTCV